MSMVLNENTGAIIKSPSNLAQARTKVMIDTLIRFDNSIISEQGWEWQRRGLRYSRLAGIL